MLVGTNVVMISTGTNTTWLLIPEFSSNLVTGAWADVPVFTNTFANGTNTTIFPRLDPICGLNRRARRERSSLVALALLSPTFRNVFVGLVQPVLICRKQDHLGTCNSHTIDDPLGIDPLCNDWSNPPT